MKLGNKIDHNSPDIDNCLIFSIKQLAYYVLWNDLGEMVNYSIRQTALMKAQYITNIEIDEIR